MMAVPPTAQPPTQQKLDIDLPPGAAPGDKLTFTCGGAGSAPMTTFSAVVPQPSMPGLPMKKISVTVPIPPTHPAGFPLQITKLFLEKQAPVRYTPEQREHMTAQSRACRVT